MAIRNTEDLKLKFQTGDKPTQEDFYDLLESLYNKEDDSSEQIKHGEDILSTFINNLFDYDKFVYKSDYPYQTGNIVISNYQNKYAIYRRKIFETGLSGKPVTSSDHWVLLIIGQNFYNNGGVIVPVEPPIKSPFVVFNEDRIYYTVNSDAGLTITPNETLTFEERAYNLAFIEKYKWVVSFNDQEIYTSENRDLIYSFVNEGEYSVILNVYEYGQETPYSDAITLTVVAEPAPAITLHKTANVAEFSQIGQIIYTLRVENTGNVPITGIVVEDQMLNANYEIPTLGVGTSISQAITYTITQGDITAGSINNTAIAVGMHEGVSVSSEDSLIILKTPTPPLLNAYWGVIREAEYNTLGVTMYNPNNPGGRMTIFLGEYNVVQVDNFEQATKDIYIEGDYTSDIIVEDTIVLFDGTNLVDYEVYSCSYSGGRTLIQVIIITDNLPVEPTQVWVYSKYVTLNTKDLSWLRSNILINGEVFDANKIILQTEDDGTGYGSPTQPLFRWHTKFSDLLSGGDTMWCALPKSDFQLMTQYAEISFGSWIDISLYWLMQDITDGDGNEYRLIVSKGSNGIGGNFCEYTTVIDFKFKN